MIDIKITNPPMPSNETVEAVNVACTKYLQESTQHWQDRGFTLRDVPLITADIDHAADALVEEIRRVQAEARRQVYEATISLWGYR